MTPFEGENAKLIHIGRMPFTMEGNGVFWSMVDHKWRRHGDREWIRTKGGCHFLLGILPPLEISLNGLPDDDVYLVTKDGYEKVEPGPPLREMIEAIMKRVKIIERRGNTVYALLEGREVAIGCVDAIILLDTQFMIVMIHEKDDRGLYKTVLPESFDTGPFEKHREGVADLYRRIVK